MNWIEAITKLSNEDRSFVLVTILTVEGSAPRDTQTKMIVDSESIYDTIGGGNLEYQAIIKARKFLTSGHAIIERHTFTLGNDLTQCCGGKVELLFECMLSYNFNIVIFGAGHVGKALIKILSELHCRVNWFDSRQEVIDSIDVKKYGTNLQLNNMHAPEIEVENCKENPYYVIMTHSHELDFQLTEAVLSRGDAKFCGLIGSKSKAAKFRSRLKRKQFTDREIENLTSPIGLEQVKGKRPMEVAVSVAAQLINMHNDSEKLSNQNNDDIYEIGIT